MAPSAPGILIACAFGSEDKAASDVLAALRAVDVGATRLPVSHRGLVFLRLIDDTAAADAHLSAHFAFASLVVFTSSYRNCSQSPGLDFLNPLPLLEPSISLNFPADSISLPNHVWPRPDPRPKLWLAHRLRGSTVS